MVCCVHEVFVLVSLIHIKEFLYVFFFFSSRRRHTRFDCDWSSDVCSSDLRVADTELVSRKIRPQGSGRPIKVGWMHGLARTYWAQDEEARGSVLSAAYNEDRKSVV